MGAILLMAMTAAGLVMAVRWQLGRFSTSAESAQDDPTITLPDGRVRLARPAATTDSAPYKSTAREQPEGEEDSHLGNPVLQPRTLRLAPPAPSRASNDPEPQAQKILEISSYPRMVPARAGPDG